MHPFELYWSSFPLLISLSLGRPHRHQYAVTIVREYLSLLKNSKLTMSNSSKEKIVADLKQAKAEGQLRSEKIREIVRSAVSQAASEVQEGSTEIRTLVKEAVGATIGALKEKGGEIQELQEEIAASIKGAIEGITTSKRQSISKSQAEVKKLQQQIEAEEEELENNVNIVMKDLEEVGRENTEQIKDAIDSAIVTLQNSEEVALMKKRYAQLRTKMAILQANLADRYGDSFDDIKNHLDDAKSWYDRAKNNPEVLKDKVEDKQQEFDKKLGEAGSAVAKKEKQMKQILSDLWKSINDQIDGK